MPKASKAQMETHRQAITSAASRLFRERGLSGVSIADLMGEAGLTHGGFYGHFDSKDALAATACEEAFTESSKRWAQRVATKPTREEAVAAMAQGYLSSRSRGMPGASCPAAALATDVAREPDDAAVRVAFAEGIEKLTEVLASVQGTGSAALDRSRALADLSTMVGALLLSRAVGDRALSDELLAAGKARVLSAA